MKNLTLLSYVISTIAMQNSAARAQTPDVCKLVPAARAAQVLGYNVDTSHSGDTSTHCMYVGKPGYADLRVMPFAGDSAKMSMLMGGGKTPPGHSFVFGRKGDRLVYVTTAPKNDRAARKLLDAAMAGL